MELIAPPIEQGQAAPADGARPPFADRDVPAVDVLMLAYNVGPYVEEAVEGVMQQRCDFPVRLVIAEDRSTDDTLARCQVLAERYPGRILLLPGEQNLGIAGRAAAGLQHCHARYLALCDGDDRWTDPLKLARQVAFLEKEPSYGLTYTDVQLITRDGQPMVPDGYDAVRAYYQSGDVFAALMRGNFINNSTVVVRRELLQDHVIGTRRDHFVHDFLMWLHVSACSKVKFFPETSTAYRQGGVSATSDHDQANAREVRSALGTLLLRHAAYHPTLPEAQRSFLFRRVLGVLLRGDTDPRTKRALLKKLPRYHPRSIKGWRTVLRRGA